MSRGIGPSLTLDKFHYAMQKHVRVEKGENDN
jgi:hypothetical protein